MCACVETCVCMHACIYVLQYPPSSIEVGLDGFAPHVELESYLRLCISQIHEISNNVVCVTSKASDQSAHTRSLIRALARRLNIL